MSGEATWAREKRRKDTLLHLVFSICIAAEVSALGYACVYILGIGGMENVFLGLGVILSAILFLWKKVPLKWKAALAIAIPVFVMAASAMVYRSWKTFSANAVYVDADLGKEKIYADRKVMLIVPHQDDDINVLEIGRAHV